MIGSFRLPASSSSSIPGNYVYERPSDWLDIDSLVSSGDHKVVLLHAVWNNDSNFCALQCASNYTVDWGDGVVENFAANVSAYHKFTYSNHAGTECSRGYRQSIVTITPQATYSLTKVDLNIKHNQPGLVTGYSTGWIDIKISGSNISTLTIGASSLNVINSNLEQFDFIGTNSITVLSYVFNSSFSLVKVKNFYTNSVVTANNSFFSCCSLKELPALNLSSATNLNSFFQGCNSIVELPMFVFNIVSPVSASAFLAECSSLKHVPLWNTLKFSSFHQFCRNCYSLEEFPLLNTSFSALFSSMYESCYSLKKAPLLDTSNATTVNQMHINNLSLEVLPFYNTSLVVDWSNFANSCISLSFFPNYIIKSSGVTMTQMVRSCKSLKEMPSLNVTGVTTWNSIFNLDFAMSKIPFTNIGVSFDLSSLSLAATELQHIFSNLKNNTAATITITGNWGADTAVSKTSCGTTAGSTVITQSNTSSLAVGMLVLGTGISDAVAVTFQDSGDTVTLNAHGLVDGNIVSFPSITTTTGITQKTPYYVVGATANTFQVSLTLGGSAIALTNNGSGTVSYASYIQSIITNTSFTVDKPASATGTVTLTNRILDTSVATLKGWTVTG